MAFKNRKICLACIALFLSFSCPAVPSGIPFPEDLSFWSDYPDEVLADEIVRRMTDSELYSQILMFGWAGAEPSALLDSWVSGRGLGSVKVFGWNTDSTELVAKSISSLQKKACSCRFRIPLFVATDQEGGWIRHVKGDTSITPGNMALGASAYPLDAWFSGYYICREIAALGINMNFAPTVDLYTDKKSTIIGTRSFGEDPAGAGVLGAAFAAGSMAAGVIPTAKHFPGHGDTENDSHVYLPDIDIDYDTFMRRELVPFKYIIRAGIPAVMSGHLSFPRIRPSGEPASLSEYFLGGILRDELGYEGLIITDDMMMNGATLYAGSLSNAFRMAVEAGNDIIISSATAQLDEALWTANLRLMKESPEFRSKVCAAARRVILAKLKYFKGENPAPLYPDAGRIPDRIPDRDGVKFFTEQACRSISAYRSSSADVGPAGSGRVLLCGSEPAFFTAAGKRYASSGEFRFRYSMGPNEARWTAENLPPVAAGYDMVVFCVSDANSAGVARSLRKLHDQGKKVVIFSIMSPVHAVGFEWADLVLCGYSYSPYTFEAMAGCCAGEFLPLGKFPLSGQSAGGMK